jgi:hypothetical protein
MRATFPDEKPSPYSPVLLSFADGQVDVGFWNGNNWVCGGFAAQPARWEPLANKPIATPHPALDQTNNR